MNWWARHSEWNRAAATPAGGRLALPATQYFAFLSYSHKDEAVAQWLHSALERFKVPASIAGRLTEHGVVPKRLSPIFRDRHELAAAEDLGEEIREALTASRFLIVLCSPAAAKSKWTNAEIDEFKRSRPDGCVIGVIVEGEPFASDLPGREDEECFPPALRQRYDRRGRPTAKRAEPLAADLREGRDRRMGLLKIVAAMLGVGLDDLVQRDQLRRQRRLAGITAASLAGMIVATILALTAVSARDAARDQRREAESLVQFMLGDLKEKLQPIGRLDALDGVGARVLTYYRKQETSDLSDASLLQRSRALSLMGEVANLRGDVAAAIRFYREAMSGTDEAIRRQPNDPERLFEHAQNVFYFGEIASLRGNNAAAEAAMREYKRLALRMIALEPDNIRWRIEGQYADANLGVVLYRQRRFAEAATPLAQALATIQGLSAADPGNTEYQRNLPEALAWLADAKMSEGKLSEAAALRERQVELLSRLLSRTRDDAFYRLRLLRANHALGEVYAMQARDLAIPRFRAAVEDAERLFALEPSNTRSLEFAFKARLSLADMLLATGKRAEAAIQTNRACELVLRLLAQDDRTPQWRAGLRSCWIMRGRLAFGMGAKEQALAHARRALQVARSVTTSDRGEDMFGVGEAYRLVGDFEHSQGNADRARSAWTAAYAALPKGVAERPREMSERATILVRLGRSAEAEQLTRKLAILGYRKPDWPAV